VIRVEDLSEVGYGGVVTGMEAWDAKRVIAGTLDPKNVVKSAKFWGYLAPGVAATIMQACLTFALLQSFHTGHLVTIVIARDIETYVLSIPAVYLRDDSVNVIFAKFKIWRLSSR